MVAAQNFRLALEAEVQAIMARSYYQLNHSPITLLKVCSFKVIRRKQCHFH